MDHESKIIVRMLLRVSSTQQLDADGDLGVQRNIVTDYIKLHDEWELDADKPEYYEGGVSGFKNSVNDRQALQEILADAEKGEFEILVCYKDDRLGRREYEIPRYIKELAGLGVFVYTVKDGCITPQSHMEDLLTYIRYWHAEGSSRDTSQRVKDAAKENVRRGRNQGGNAPYGYRLEFSGEYNKHQRALKKKVIDAERAGIVRYMYHLAKTSGYGSQKIASILNSDEAFRTMSPNGEVWKSGTVRDILRNPIYTGYEVYNRREKRNGHYVRLHPSEWILSEECKEEMQIISPELWEEVQSLREERKKRMEDKKENNGHAQTRTSQYLALLDVAHCGYCGRKLTNGSKYNYWTTKDGEKRKSVVGYYRCQAKHQGELCRGKTSYRADHLESNVFEFVMEYLSTLEDNRTVLEKLIEAEQEQKKEVQRNLKSKRRALEQTEKNRKILEEHIPLALCGECSFSAEELQEQIRKNEEKRRKLEEEIRNIERELSTRSREAAEVDLFISRIPKWKEVFKSGSVDEKRVVMNKLIERIDLWDGKIQIHVRVNLKEFLSRKSGNKPTTRYRPG